MNVQVFKAKIHRVRITEVNLNYMMSITIDENLLDATGILPNEHVQIVNLNNGERLETYVIKGERGSGQICLNGPSTRRMAVGDLIIISYGYMDYEEAKTLDPIVMYQDENNAISNT